MKEQMCKIINSNCNKEMIEIFKTYEKIIVVSDPPFNIGYKYNKYNDNMDESDYYKMLCFLFGNSPSVIIHYPESLYKLSVEMGKCPERVVSWVYNSNTARQHRDIAFFDVKPDFNAVRQPYKNPNDKRIKKRKDKTSLSNATRSYEKYNWYFAERLYCN